MTQPFEMMTPRQVAKTKILPDRTIRRLIAEGKIPTIKSGRTMYINYTLLSEQLASGKGEIWN